MSIYYCLTWVYKFDVFSIWGMKEESRDWALWLMAKIRIRLLLVRQRRSLMFLASLVPGHWTRYRWIAATSHRRRAAPWRRRWWSGTPISVIVFVVISPLYRRRRWINQSAAITLILVTVTWHRTILVTSILTRATRTTTHRASWAATRASSGFRTSATTPRCAAWSAKRVASENSMEKI